MVQSFLNDETSMKVNNVRSSHHEAHKSSFCETTLVKFSEEEDADTILKEPLTYVGANPELNPKRGFDAEREKKQEEFGNSHGHIDHRIAEQMGSLKGTSKKKSSGDYSNKQNVDQKPEIKVEVSEANEGESVPNVSEEESNGKETDKISENGINGTKKVDEIKVKATKAPESNEKDVKAEEKPLVETYKKNEDVSREKRRCHRLVTSLVPQLSTHSFPMIFQCTESVTRAKKSKEARKAHAPKVQSKSGLLAIPKPVSGEADEYRSKQVPGGQARSHDKRHGHGGRGGKYNKNGKG